MKHIVLITFFCVLSIYTNAQGLQFNTFESETVQKTSYSVFATPPHIKDSLILSYDLAVLDPSSFGYICRIYNQENSTVYSLVFSYNTDRQSDITFNIEGQERLLIDTLENKNLGNRHWMPIRMAFSIAKDSATICIGKQAFSIGRLKLSKSIRPYILFGSSKFSEEIPSFAIRNLMVETDGKGTFFPLNESKGEAVHDSDGAACGTAVNPIWLINRSYHWKFLYAHLSTTTAGYAYDEVSDSFLHFNKDSLHTLNLSTQTVTASRHEPFPMSLQLGTSFLLPSQHSLCVYEVAGENGNHGVCLLNMETGNVRQVSGECLEAQRHHHAACYDAGSQKYYIFGGFGSRKYSNRLNVYDLARNQWSVFPLKGSDISPRFFSSMGMLNDSELLLFGGTGNEYGDQSIGKVWYYDLYKINLRDSSAIKLQDYTYMGKPVVPVRNLILSDDSTSFYTLCYPMQEASSYLQVYRFSLNDDSYEILADSIPFESKNILSNASLYYNRQSHILYCCTQEFDEKGGEASITKLYSLSAPPIPKNYLHLYTGKNTDRIGWMGVCLFIIAAAVAGLYVCFHKKRKKPAAVEKNRQSIKTEVCAMKANAIYLFGDFTVLDKKGKDITYFFSTKIKHLFLLILLYSLKQKEGITSTRIYELLWPEKDSNSAKNLKGVTINRLRKAIEDIEGVELLYTNGHYILAMSSNVYCDYAQLPEYINHLKGDSSISCAQRLYQIVSRGAFLKGIDESMFDSFKDEFEQNIQKSLYIEIETLFKEKHYDTVVLLSDILLKVDSLNETALWYAVNACRKLHKEEQGKKLYARYAAEHYHIMGKDYRHPYNDFVHTDPEQFS